MSDSAAGGFPGSLGAHHGGGGSKAPAGVDAMIRELFSPTLCQNSDKAIERESML